MSRGVVRTSGGGGRGAAPGGGAAQVRAAWASAPSASSPASPSSPLVLPGIAELRWEKGDCCFAGSVVACMEFLGQYVGYDFVMGVSGGAFRLMWHPQWCPSNHDLLVLGEEPIRRTFRALGYEYELVPRDGDATGPEQLRRRIVASLSARRPVLAHGVVGPECCVIAGYDPSSDQMLGRSYFQPDGEYFRESNWYRQCWGLILIGRRGSSPGQRAILYEAMQWALDLARQPQRQGHVSGLAAYGVWAEALLRDEDFPPGDLNLLTYRCAVSNSATLFGLCEARRVAASFLRMVTAGQQPLPGSVAALSAAAAYEQEAAILQEAVALAPSYFDAPDKRRLMAEPLRRRTIANLLFRARDKNAQAVAHLNQAIDDMRRAG